MRKTKETSASRGLWRHEGGHAAVEFALLTPLLMLMVLGAVELGRAFNNDRHFNAAIDSTGDLVAREAFLGTSSGAAKQNLDDMMKSIQHLMRPYDASKLQLAVYSVKVSGNDTSKGKVEWVYPYNGMSAKSQCSEYTLPPNVVVKGGSIIVVEGQYQFKPLFGTYIPGMRPTMTWTDKSFHNPRNACVDYVEGDNCMSHC